MEQEQGSSVFFPRAEEETGSGLIWFTGLLSLVALLSGILVSASHEYLFARKLTDYAEEFVLAAKTRLNLDARLGISDVGKDIYLATASHFNFRNLRVQEIELSNGRTVHAFVCADWVAPFPNIIVAREICVEAFAR